MDGRAAGQQHPREGDVLVLAHVAEVVLDREPVLTRPAEGFTNPPLADQDACVHRRDRAHIRGKVNHEFRLG